MASIDIERTESQARDLLNTRIESVRGLVKTRQRITDLQAQLAEAEREDKRAYVRATKDGWSPDELKKLGLEPAAAGRRRKAGTKTPGTDSTTIKQQPAAENGNTLGD